MAGKLMIAAGVALALSGAAYGQVAGSGTMGPGVVTDSAGNVVSDPRANRDARRGATTVDPRRLPSNSPAPLGTTGGIDAGSVRGNAIGSIGSSVPGALPAPGVVGSSPGPTGGASVGGAAGAGGVGVGAGAGDVGVGASASGVGTGAGAAGAGNAVGGAR